MKHITKYKNKGYARFEYQPRFFDPRHEALELRKKELTGVGDRNGLRQQALFRDENEDFGKKRRLKRIKQSAVLLIFLYLVYHFGNPFIMGTSIATYLVYILSLFVCVKGFIYISRS